MRSISPSRSRACQSADTRPRKLTGRIPLLFLCALAATAAGCRTGPPMEPVDLRQPGWTVQHGQAVWQPKADAPELAGQLLLASNEAGDQFVRFSKEPMEIALARRTTTGWNLEIAAFNKSFSGRSRPPQRIGWFQLADAVFHDSPAKGWIWSGIDEGRWELANPKTGERLEGFFTE